jgi:hypothetical protein
MANPAMSLTPSDPKYKKKYFWYFWMSDFGFEKIRKIYLKSALQVYL